MRRVLLGVAVVVCISACKAKDEPEQAMSSKAKAAPVAESPGEGRKPDPSPPSTQPPQRPQQRTPEDIARGSLPSVVLIIVNDSHSQPLAMGSGFLVKDGVVATNFHVIEGGFSASVKNVDSDSPVTVDGILAADPDQDLALLKVSGLHGAPLPMATGKTVEIGERVYAVGNPKGLQGTFSEGIVSAKRSEHSRTLVQITAPISPGSSGGPVLDKDGAVIGIATATLKDGQNLNFAVGVDALATLIAGSGSNVRPFGGMVRKKASLPDGKALGAAITFAEFMWDKQYDFEGGSYTVTIRNALNRPVKSVIALVVFYDASKAPLETSVLTFDDVIPAGLARLAHGSVDGTIKVRVSETILSGTAYDRHPIPGRVELRALDFQFAD